MLDTDTRRRIDTARDILVGKVPDPKSQVEQITIALIYKFMDDMDAAAEELGGKRTFFAGDFARYGWAKLMRSGLGGHEALNLYAEGITRMTENANLPPLFRDIFKNAYLPYRDPETLRSFLKIIDEFTYDHSERLGDAFEYLLSVLGSQGDAGQFRTPRHIIDFMVEIVDPKKDERILDPACGTAGFLISSFKHIRRANRDADDNITLTPDEKERLAGNFEGYDISPDMVRLSLVNLYLHGFVNPRIHEYDTLTSDDRWGDYADVILANPPFMSPKGGIRPHRRFAIQAKRSEVLFVDYMAEHLTPTGRAGIIVPEGIIFQSQTAYKALRKMLVDSCLVAVVSLPAGVFQPYSGVKTSILILDRGLNRRSDAIAFFKVENDGFGLGAQRREIDANDLPEVKTELCGFLDALRRREPTDGLTFAHGLVVKKEKIAANGDYSLSGERYRENGTSQSCFQMVSLGDVARIIAGQSPLGESYNEVGAGMPFYQGKTEFGDIFIGAPTRWTTDPQRFADPGDILMSVRAPVGPVNIATQRICIGRGLAAIRAIPDRLLTFFAFYLLRNMQNEITGKSGATFASINRSDIEKIRIPLPAIDVQSEIVTEIQGYQKIIDGARAVIDNYRPHIPIDPEWPMVELGSIASFGSGGTPSKENASFWTGTIPWVSAKDMKTDVLYDASTHVSEMAAENSATRIAPVGSLLILVRGMGLANGVPICELAVPCAFNQDVKAINPSNSVSATFLRLMLKQEEPQFKRILETAAHGTLKINTDDLSRIRFPLPHIDVQRRIVAEIEAEQRLVDANRELVERFETKIQIMIDRVWGEVGSR